MVPLAKLIKTCPKLLNPNFFLGSDGPDGPDGVVLLCCCCYVGGALPQGSAFARRAIYRTAASVARRALMVWRVCSKNHLRQLRYGRDIANSPAKPLGLDFFPCHLGIHWPYLPCQGFGACESRSRQAAIATPTSFSTQNRFGFLIQVL
jgi:hypothetical protein